MVCRADIPVVVSTVPADEQCVAQLQGRNIRHYAGYLSERSRAYRDTKTDWVRAPESRLEKMTVDKGLLRETEAVQRQLQALLKCNVRYTMRTTTWHILTHAGSRQRA